MIDSKLRARLSRHSTLRRLAAGEPLSVHPDYQPTGIAPRMGHMLKVLSKHPEVTSTVQGLSQAILHNGDHSVLPILSDALQEDGGEAAWNAFNAFDWQHAPRAIEIDKALETEIGRHRIRQINPDTGRRENRPLSPGWVLADWKEKTRGRVPLRRAVEIVRQRVPDATKADVVHSVLRLVTNHNNIRPAFASVENLRRQAAIPQSLRSYGNMGERIQLEDKLAHDTLVPPSSMHDHYKSIDKANMKMLGVPEADPHAYPDTRLQRRRLSRFRDAVRRLAAKQWWSDNYEDHQPYSVVTEDQPKSKKPQGPSRNRPSTTPRSPQKPAPVIATGVSPPLARKIPAAKIIPKAKTIPTAGPPSPRPLVAYHVTYRHKNGGTRSRVVFSSKGEGQIRGVTKLLGHFPLTVREATGKEVQKNPGASTRIKFSRGDDLKTQGYTAFKVMYVPKGVPTVRTAHVWVRGGADDAKKWATDQGHEVEGVAEVEKEETPVREDAYRAPAGGMIVRGTYYKGGSLTPDLMKFARAFGPQRLSHGEDEEPEDDATELRPGETTADGGKFEPEKEPNLEEFITNQFKDEYGEPEEGISNATGFLLSDGRGVPMGPGERYEDHRAAIPTSEAMKRWGWNPEVIRHYEESTRTPALFELMRRSGALRIHSGGDQLIVHAASPLTSRQKRAIRDHVEVYQPDTVILASDKGHERELHSPDKWEITRALDKIHEPVEADDEDPDRYARAFSPARKALDEDGDWYDDETPLSDDNPPSFTVRTHDGVEVPIHGSREDGDHGHDYTFVGHVDGKEIPVASMTVHRKGPTAKFKVQLPREHRKSGIAEAVRHHADQVARSHGASLGKPEREDREDQEEAPDRESLGMSDQESFLRHIAQNQDDDLAPQVFADFLEENGHHHTASIIRGQNQLQGYAKPITWRSTNFPHIAEKPYELHAMVEPMDDPDLQDNADVDLYFGHEHPIGNQQKLYAWSLNMPRKHVPDLLRGLADEGVHGAKEEWNHMEGLDQNPEREQHYAHAFQESPTRMSEDDDLPDYPHLSENSGGMMRAVVDAGHRDRTPILADALEEGGEYHDEETLHHLRKMGDDAVPLHIEEVSPGKVKARPAEYSLQNVEAAHDRFDRYVRRLGGTPKHPEMGSWFHYDFDGGHEDGEPTATFREDGGHRETVKASDAADLLHDWIGTYLDQDFYHIPSLSDEEQETLEKLRRNIASQDVVFPPDDFYDDVSESAPERSSRYAHAFAG